MKGDVYERDYPSISRPPIIGKLRAAVEVKQAWEGDPGASTHFRVAIERIKARIDDLLDQYNAIGFMGGIAVATAEPDRKRRAS